MIVLIMMLSDQMNPIEKHKWNNRVLIVIAESPNHIGYKQQEQVLTKGKRGMKERDLIIYKLYSDHWVGPNGNSLNENEANVIYQTYGIKPGTFSVVLIGKDGGVKMRNTDLVEIKDVFDLIDSMPMRRQEMRDKDGN